MRSSYRPHRLKGASLVVALIVSIIIASFCAGAILLAQLTDRLALRSMAERKARDDAWSGLQVLLGPQQAMLPEDEPIMVDLFDDGRDTVSLLQYRWGLFRAGIVIAERPHARCVKRCLIGSGYPANDPALSLLDVGRPLALSGHTSLRGPCELPKAGVRKAQVEGRTFHGDTLVHGPISPAPTARWALDSTLATYLRGILAGIVPPDAEVITLEGSTPDSLLHRSFEAPLLWAQAVDPSALQGRSVHGRVIVFSRDTLYVAPDCDLRDALVCAPVIIFEKAARVRGQFFASRAIIMREGVRCGYPTVLGVRIDAMDASHIDLGAGSLVQGDVVQWMDAELQAPRSTITLAADASIHGSIRTPALVEIRGSVSGSVRCGGTIFHTGSGIYENHLVDAVIDVTARHPDQASGSIGPTGHDHAVISWLGP